LKRFNRLYALGWSDDRFRIADQRAEDWTLISLSSLGLFALSSPQLGFKVINSTALTSNYSTWKW